MPNNLDTPERRAAANADAMAALKKGYVVTGVRLVDSDNAENGHVVTFDEREGKALAGAVKEIVSARAEKKAAKR
jgi:hypothetical protein